MPCFLTIFPWLKMIINLNIYNNNILHQYFYSHLGDPVTKPKAVDRASLVSFACLSATTQCVFIDYLVHTVNFTNGVIKT